MALPELLLAGIALITFVMAFTTGWRWFFAALAVDIAALVLLEILVRGDPGYPGDYLVLALIERFVVGGSVVVIGIVALVKAMLLKRKDAGG